jgi:16S rRNA (guanine527-N7)-methyltransferase
VNFKHDVEVLLGQSLSQEQIVQFEVYYQFLIEYNQITYLTRITEKNEVYYKHFFDSLSLINICDFNRVFSLCDMGAGAGFPSLPLKILYPHLEVTIVDSLGKRITFLT